MAENAELNAKQELFCQYYVQNGFNGTQAAISAGYAKNSANEQSARMLAKASIYERIEQLKAKLIRKVELRQEDVLRTIVTALNLDLTDIFDIRNSQVYVIGNLRDLPIEVRQCIQSIEQTKFGVKITMISKERMLTLAMNYLGMTKPEIITSGDASAKSPEEIAARIQELIAKRDQGSQGAKEEK